MKQKVKLRDLTEEQYNQWLSKHCHSTGDPHCRKCLFNYVFCKPGEDCCWIRHKNLDSDKFLDQTITIDVPGFLTKEEHDYLEVVIKPFRDKLIRIGKGYSSDCGMNYIYFVTKNRVLNGCFSEEVFELPLLFKANTAYIGMERGKEYILEELEL